MGTNMLCSHSFVRLGVSSLLGFDVHEVPLEDEVFELISEAVLPKLAPFFSSENLTRFKSLTSIMLGGG